MSDGAASIWRTFVRHQMGSALASVVDFSWMAFAVQRLGFGAATATIMGSSLGAVVGFLLGRVWIFRPSSRVSWASGAARYAIVSLAGALLSGGGMFVAVDIVGINYLSARMGVALAVGVFWSFPAQRSLVFSPGLNGDRGEAA